MSGQRSSSAGVRDLRSMFESKQSSADASSSSPRGRSPLGSLGGADAPLNQPTSTVRASFVDVGPAPSMSAAVVDSQPALDGANPGPIAANAETSAANPDKPVTGAEEEPGAMRPADPASEGAISRGHALPPTPEDLRKRHGHVNGVKPATKKEAVSSQSTAKQPAPKPSSTAKPPAGQVKSPLASSRLGHAKKPTPVSTSSRSSLTAPTAASLARAEATSDKAKTSPSSKPRPREVTKPINLPSHLTAPTAASRAKHSAEPAGPASTSLRASLSVRNKASRSSLAPRQRADSSSSATSAKRQSTVPVEGSFLERMMKPTAASQSRNADRLEVHSPPRSKTAAPASRPAAAASKAPAPAAKAAAPAPRSKPTNVNGTSAPKAAAKPKSSAPPPSSSKPAAAAGGPAASAKPTSAEEKPAQAAEPAGPAEPEASRHEQPLNATDSEPAQPDEPLKLVDESLAPTEAEIPALDEATTQDSAIEPPADEKVEDVIPLTAEPASKDSPAEKAELTAPAGDTTPQHQHQDNRAAPALEATPAGLSGGDTIR